MILITLDYAKRHLEMDHDEDDLLISLYIEAASEAIVAYLKDGAGSFLDSSGGPEYNEFDEPIGIPKRVQIATMILVGYFYKNRDENPVEAFEYGFLPKPVMAVLHQMRDPALA